MTRKSIQSAAISSALEPICKIIHEAAYEACNQQDIYRVAQHVAQLRGIEKLHRDLERLVSIERL